KRAWGGWGRGSNPTNPPPPVTRTRLNRLTITLSDVFLQLRRRRLGGLCQAGAPARSPAHVDVEHRMAQRQMRHLDEAVFLILAPDIEIHVAGAAKLVGLTEPRIGHHFAAARASLFHGAENVRRVAGARDRDQYVARPGVEFELLGEHVLIAEVVAEAGQRGR